MARILGIDFGTKRLGVAVSDESNTIATAKPFINTQSGNVLKAIESIIDDYKCEQVVVGLPINLDGQDTEITQRVREFARRIQELLDVPVQLFDERLSSDEAHAILDQMGIRDHRDKVDSLSAQIILQNYLDSIK